MGSEMSCPFSGKSFRDRLPPKADMAGQRTQFLMTNPEFSFLKTTFFTPDRKRPSRASTPGGFIF
jgi:hypothetical protein